MSKRPVSVTHDAEDTDMPTGLLRRDGGRYSTRRRIPQDLVAHYKGRAELVRALDTSDPAEARRRHALMWVALDQEFDAARAALKQAPPPPAGPSAKWLAMTPEQRAEWQRQKDEYDRDYEEYLEQQWLEEEFDPERQTVSEAVARARVKWEADLAEQRAASLAKKKAAENTTATPLATVVEKWVAEKKPGPRFEVRVRKVIEDFQALNGSLNVQAVTKQHVLAFRDALVTAGQSPANTNLLIGMIGTILIYARDKLHLIAGNAAAKMTVDDPRRDKDKRRAFEDHEIKAIFDSPVFTKGLRPAAAGGEAAYWLPLLALYTGARQTELGQLHPDDVREEAYVDAEGKERSAWVMRIVENAARDQQVKNEGSERRIPIHDDLIKLGFVKLAQAALAEGRERIFPDIKKNSAGVLMGSWSKWFGRYRRKECGVEGKDTPFHSFRHSFKHVARLCAIPNEINNEFTGHETGDVADTYGGLSYPLHPLVEGMKKFRVPNFTLPAPPGGAQPE